MVGAPLLLIYQTKKQSQKLAKSVLEFHDFLIGYRQTPRSKLLKRHLPSLDAIVEEPSVYEKSVASIILSGSSKS